jgi:hypothetical protein
MGLVPLEKRMLFAPSSTSFLPVITKITTFATFIWFVTSLLSKWGRNNSFDAELRSITLKLLYGFASGFSGAHASMFTKISKFKN